MIPSPPIWIEEHDDDLPEVAPVGGRVDDDEAGDADRGRRRERRRQHRRATGPAVATGSIRSPVPTRMASANASEIELGRMAEREEPTHASTFVSGAPQQG